MTTTSDWFAQHGAPMTLAEIAEAIRDAPPQDIHDWVHDILTSSHVGLMPGVVRLVAMAPFDRANWAIFHTPPDREAAMMRFMAERNCPNFNQRR